MNTTNQYNLYIINGKVYVYFEDIEFDDVTFDKKNNLIRIGYDKTTTNSDEYLIEINTKTRHSTLKTYPNIVLTFNIRTYDKNDNYNKIYPYYGKNTTIINKKEMFINNKNIYPKYFKLNNNIKYVIDTKVKYNCDENIITESILAEIYSIIFHLRLNIIEKNLDKNFDDYFDTSNKIEIISYNIGESLFHNGYYGPTKRTIKLYDEKNDDDYNELNEDNDEQYNNDQYNDEQYNDDDDDESTIDNEEFMPDIIKLNVNLTNKILELEQQISILITNMNNKNNNIDFKINENSNIIKYHETILYLYFIFFIVISIILYF